MALHLRIRVILVAILAASCAASCTRDSSSPSSEKSQPQWKRGAPAFSFDYLAVTEVMISKNDPATGDRWDAQFKKTGTEMTDGSFLWEILSGPAGSSLADRNANTSFILHLLDTLRTLTIQNTAPNGPPASFGLDSPRLTLRWKTPENAFEIRFGTRTQEGTYAFIPAYQRTFTVQGATITMMDFVTSFDYLRQIKLHTWTADDVWELELKPARGPRFYAQRLGSDWADQKEKPLRLDVQSFLEGVLHLQIREFVDDGALIEKRQKEISSHLKFALTLKDREGKSIQTRIAPLADGLYATISDRPGVYRLYDTAEKLFSPPRGNIAHSPRKRVP